MKIVKLRSGYKLNMSDSEFEAMRFMCDQGQAAALERDQHAHLSNGAKVVIRREPFTTPGGPLIVTENRRVPAQDAAQVAAE